MITGIIVEYNPLHNGHIYHIDKAKKITNADAVIAVMSGNFVQRGEPAFLNKWARTKMALKAGVDLVIELPFLYSTSSAEGFAFGSTAILDSLGIVDNICFGSECGDVEKLKAIANILCKEPENYKIMLKEYLNLGLSFPVARQKALSEYIIKQKLENVNSIELENIIFSSNNILGIEYLKAMNRLNSNMQPYTVTRINNSYNEVNLSGSISSATAIRRNYGNNEVIKATLPSYCYDIIDEEIRNGRGPINLNDFSDIILQKIRTMNIEDIKNTLEVNEGLEYKIKKAAEDAKEVSELIDIVKNKRITNTRIQRILINILLGVSKEYKNNVKELPKYIRILGFNERGKTLIRKIKKTIELPVIVNPSRLDTTLLDFDIKATDTYVLAYKNKEFKRGKQDLLRAPIMEV